MAERVFVDSNLWLYAAMEDEEGDEKCAIAKNIIEQGCNPSISHPHR